ncbi:MAG TPA: response regulator [Desulfuromonadales bacterium]|nr:response regulator [Desulfuromonadales bacterium]
MARIVVIDDDSGICLLLQEYLTEQGYMVDTAENGKEGLKLVGLHHYDLVITDIVMPEMDGFEVITAIKKKSPHTGLIAMTGGSVKLHQDVLLTTAELMRADRVISKPINLKELMSAVTEILAA